MAPAMRIWPAQKFLNLRGAVSPASHLVRQNHYLTKSPAKLPPAKLRFARGLTREGRKASFLFSEGYPQFNDQVGVH